MRFRSLADRLIKGLGESAGEALQISVLRPPTFERLRDLMGPIAVVLLPRPSRHAWSIYRGTIERRQFASGHGGGAAVLGYSHLWHFPKWPVYRSFLANV